MENQAISLNLKSVEALEKELFKLSADFDPTNPAKGVKQMVKGAQKGAMKPVLQYQLANVPVGKTGTLKGSIKLKQSVAKSQLKRFKRGTIAVTKVGYFFTGVNRVRQKAIAAEYGVKGRVPNPVIRNSLFRNKQLVVNRFRVKLQKQLEKYSMKKLKSIKPR